MTEEEAIRWIRDRYKIGSFIDTSDGEAYLEDELYEISSEVDVRIAKKPSGWIGVGIRIPCSCYFISDEESFTPEELQSYKHIMSMGASSPSLEDCVGSYRGVPIIQDKEELLERFPDSPLVLRYLTEKAREI